MSDVVRVAPAGGALSGAASAVRASAAHLVSGLRRQPWVGAFVALYVLGKVGLNLAQGAALGRALTSALVGLGYMGVLVVVMDAIAWARAGAFRDETVPGTCWERPRPLYVAVALGVWLFWLAGIVDGLQAEGAMPGEPLLSWLPGWRALDARFGEAGQHVSRALGVLSPAAAESTLRNVVLRFLVPVVLLLALGLRPRDLGLGRRGWAVAAPVVGLLGAAYLASALGAPPARSLAALGATLLYPALVEEFLYRGLLQRGLSAWLGPIRAILAAALLFSLLHGPSYYCCLYAGNLLLTVGNLLDVMLAGVFWGYGYLRTGSLWPWILVHALADLTGL